ncbi:MAG: DUF1592 domain-containing protein, partial [Myxococcota bacterium]
PLTDSERDRYLSLFETGATLEPDGYAPRTGVEMVLEAILQSPHFLYRVELGASGASGLTDTGDSRAVPLTSYEMASRLSYLLWNTMPDSALLEAAARDELREPEQIAAQARRMLATPRAREAVKNFHRQWLKLDDIEPITRSNGKNYVIYPEYRESLLRQMRRETELFLDHAIFDADASVQALFTAPYTMLNEELAEYYGVTRGPGHDPDAFVRVDLDPQRYAGFLTQPGLLALHAKPDRSSPIHRGKFIRETLLCQTPPPPPDVVPEPPEVDTEQTTRAQFEEHASDPLCKGCHQMMDPIGFGFEHFDGIGRYRDTEWGLTIDARGEIIGTSDADGPFDGAVELAHRLGDSQQVRDCVTTQWFRYAYGRTETAEDTCSMDTIRQSFAASGHDIKELIVALTQTDAFRYRRPTPVTEDDPD